MKQNSKTLMVIPTLGDRPELLIKTLQSIAIQGNDIIDVFIVCPKNIRGIEKIALEFGADIINDPGGGISVAVNAGFANAKPSHVYGLWMGDDDLLLPDSLATTIPLLENNPEAVAVFGYCDYIDDNDKYLFRSGAGKLSTWIMTWGPDLVPLPGLLFRINNVKKLGGFDTSLKYAMDLDMWLKLRKVGKFIFVKKSLGSFRWHSTSTTVANRSASIDEAECVKRKHLPTYIRPFSLLWNFPVRWATYLAVKRANKMAAIGVSKT